MNNIPTETDSFALRAQQRRRFIIHSIINGFRSAHWSKKSKMTFWAFTVFSLLILAAKTPICNFFYDPPLSGIFDTLFPILYVVFALPALFVVAFFLGSPKGSWEMYRNLMRAGFVNSAKEAPIMTARLDSPDKIHSTFMFETCGLPVDFWQDNIPALESALNYTIIKIEQGKNKRFVILEVLPGDMKLPDKVDWSWDKMPKESSVLLIGESLLGTETVDLNIVPHILIGGSTGSGKTVLVKCLAGQCIQHGAEVIIADFKGVDFYNLFWVASVSRLCLELQTLLVDLTYVVEQLEFRKKAFQETHHASLNEYNKKENQSLKRIIFVCDEISELLDKKGRSKEEKETIDKIIGMLSKIARQGRTFGINLILATQRPDAEVLPGQIKNNMDYRVCGRADNTLSMIILDTADANDAVPKDKCGRFINNSGTILQAYYFRDDMLGSKPVAKGSK